MYDKILFPKNHHTGLRGVAAALVLGAAIFSVGCSGSGGSSNSDEPTGSRLFSLSLPDSLTGGVAASNPRSLASRALNVAKSGNVARSSNDVGEPCFYDGVEDDVFRNGYRMSKFMISAVATWTCLSDTIIDLSNSVPHDGLIQEAENDTMAANYEADEPTHFSVTDDSATQTTVRLYYGFDRSVPPTSGDKPGFFLSWNEADNGDVSGRMVVDGNNIDPLNSDPEAPVDMRVDFNYTDTAKVADMFLRFDNGNAWADGLRIEVTKDLTVSPLGQVFTARGLMEMKAQFMPVSGITEIPQLRMYTVSDRLGEGAAVAEFVDMSLPLEIDADTGDHLGNYIFDKTDIYFFDANQNSVTPWDWIDKRITDSQYRGGRNLVKMTTADIISFLGLSPTYFSGTECANVGDDCTVMLNAIFADGFAEQEQNQGMNPMDWRSTAITSPAYLGSVYPNGSDWSGAFDLTFMP
ncbi:MAG TPA: hypothetical protein ENK04_13425 [Gammaproteobacteria bacterium]|nr:hypothetical protein [Gammaproteobacteria bacterium]